MFQFETWTRIYPGVIYNLKMLATAVFILISQIWAAPPQPPAVSCGNGNYVPFKAHTDAYKTESEEQKLDIWIPQGAPKPYKTIVLIHGGCFKAGGRDSGDSMIQINRLVKAGYAVASVDYRVTKMDAKTGAFSDTYPTSLNDVQDAWCWLQKNGSNRGLDTEKMVAMG
ncbi:MAG: alpha/beta hydrolase, partial [Bdellovibrionales bacterium]